jgi:hypothetical protein
MERNQHTGNCLYRGRLSVMWMEPFILKIAQERSELFCVITLDSSCSVRQNDVLMSRML